MKHITNFTLATPVLNPRQAQKENVLKTLQQFHGQMLRLSAFSTVNKNDKRILPEIARINMIVEAFERISNK